MTLAVDVRVARDGFRLDAAFEVGPRETVALVGPNGAGKSTLVAILAGLLASGAVSMMRYGQTLYLLPISLFGMSIAASELPELSRAGEARLEDVRARVRGALERITFLLVPSTLGYLVLGDVIVSVDTARRQSNRFGLSHTEMVTLLMIHGILHLLGFEHEGTKKGARQMAQKQKELLMKTIRKR